MMSRLRLSPSAVLALLAVLVLAAVLAGILLTRARALAAPDQPIAYSHRTHIEAGVQCLFCHSGALRSDTAGIPAAEKCMGCHSVIAADRPAIQAVADKYGLRIIEDACQAVGATYRGRKAGSFGTGATAWP